MPSNISKLTKEEMFKDYETDKGRLLYKDVFDPVSSPKLSHQSRSQYDEDYDVSTGVIAGDGRTLADAREIWDFFRITFHEDRMVKSIFKTAFGLDPDSTTALDPAVKNLLVGRSEIDPLFKRYYVQGISGEDSALPEYNTLLDYDFEERTVLQRQQKIK